VSAVAIVLIVSSLAAVFQFASEASMRTISWPRTRNAEDPAGWRRLAALYEWIREETPVDGVLIGDLDPAYFLYTDRKAVHASAPNGYVLYYDTRSGANPLETVDTFRQRTLDAGADFWVWSDGANRLALYASLRDEVSRQYPGSLSAATGDPATGYAVYRIHRALLRTSSRAEAEP
jgi:hypothetical protein